MEGADGGEAGDRLEVALAVSGSYGTHCDHVYENVETGRRAQPFVLAAYVEMMPVVSHSPPPMFLGRKYRCCRCRRTIDLSSRAYGALPCPPQSTGQKFRLHWD